jgi:hypothetical protein
MSEEQLSPGTWLLYCPRGSLGSALVGSLNKALSRDGAEKTMHEHIDALVRCARAARPPGLGFARAPPNSIGRNSRALRALTSPCSRPAHLAPPTLPRRHASLDAALQGPLGVGSWNPTPATYRLGAGALLAVHYGLHASVAGARRVEPSVHGPGGGGEGAACVLQGCLSNLDELAESHLDGGSAAGGGAGRSPAAVAARGDVHGLAAEALAAAAAASNGEPLLLLSELQGRYSFALYDAERRSVLAARDPSGGEPLFARADDDGGVALSNARLALGPPGGWAEVPPGHYVAGRHPRVRQFALSAGQLRAREAAEEADADYSPPSSGRAAGRSPRAELAAASSL